jgi:hypothetical protein
MNLKISCIVVLTINGYHFEHFEPFYILFNFSGGCFSQFLEACLSILFLFIKQVYYLILKTIAQFQSCQLQANFLNLF